MRALVEGQMHSVNEFQHMKKALDLLTLQRYRLEILEVPFLISFRGHSTYKQSYLNLCRIHHSSLSDSSESLSDSSESLSDSSEALTT